MSTVKEPLHPLRTARYLWLGILLCALVGGACFLGGRWSAGRSETAKIDTVVLQNQLSEIRELATVTYAYTNMAQFESSNDFYGVKIPFTTKSFILTYDGTVKAGVDLDGAEVSVSGTTVTITLPEAEILSHEIDEDSMEVFDGIYEEFPCLVMEDHVPKGVRFSTALSAMDFTGFYFPFTGEANLNIDSPACYLPSTIAHEMAHQRGIASEQECNFIAIAASTTAQSPAYRYSGWLMGFTYLSNALYRADQEAWKQVRVLLPDTVVADLRDNSAYWAEFEGPVNDAAQKVYDSFLKSSGESRGTQSYGTVVDMLMAYYG